jgi:hypothetical protein
MIEKTKKGIRMLVQQVREVALVALPPYLVLYNCANKIKVLFGSSHPIYKSHHFKSVPFGCSDL